VTIVVLLLVVVGWVAYFGHWLVGRREVLPHDSVHSFNQQLSVLSALDRTTARAARPTPDGQPPLARRNLAPVPDPFRLTRTEARRRRRDIFSFLVAAAVLTVVLAFLLGGVAWYAHLLVDGTLLTYVTLLARSQKLAAERSAKVRYLPQHQGGAEPAFVLQRTAASR
jgi:hypothetical protein